ncbi:hypothetical protein CRG98_012549 [Punica granatum]|uniref:Uncharacterized protein n=1 Tax=Punica granatum TaxID=22663 RepID=A0A2I0KET1_PUNGR|nr:hypothetical protein CRG98_012549 [Punica granatum]
METVIVQAQARQGGPTSQAFREGHMQSRPMDQQRRKHLPAPTARVVDGQGEPTRPLWAPDRVPLLASPLLSTPWNYRSAFGVITCYVRRRGFIESRELVGRNLNTPG